jgi:hypothetical protein
VCDNCVSSQWQTLWILSIILIVIKNVLIETRMMDNIQKVCHCHINPSLSTYLAYFAQSPLNHTYTKQKYILKRGFTFIRSKYELISCLNTLYWIQEFWKCKSGYLLDFELIKTIINLQKE